MQVKCPKCKSDTCAKKGFRYNKLEKNKKNYSQRGNTLYYQNSLKRKAMVPASQKKKRVKGIK